MMSRTDEWGTPLPEQGPEAEFTIEHRTSEIRDQKGELVVTLEMELRDYPSRLETFQLENLVFKSLDGQKNIRLQDLVPFGETKILISKTRINNYHCNPIKNIVLGPPLETGLDIGILFHELGHAIQDTEEYWFKYRNGYEVDASKVRNHPQSSLLGAINLLKLMKADGSLIATNKETAQQLINNRDEIIKESETGSWRDAGYDIHEQKMNLQNNFLSEHFGATKVDLESWISRLVAGDDSAFEEMKQVGIFLTSIEDHSYLEPDDDQLRIIQEQIKNDAKELLRVQIDALRQLSDSLLVPLDDDTIRQHIWISINKPSDDRIFAEVNTEFAKGLAFNFPIRLTASIEEYSDFIRKANELDEEQIRASEAYKSRKESKEQLYQQTLELFLINEEDLVIDLDRPRKMMERDATRRALVWIRELKQNYGIDLTGMMNGAGITTNLMNKFEGLSEEEIQEYTREIEKFDANPSISGDLFLALRTHGAGKGQMKKEEKRKISVPEKI